MRERTRRTPEAGNSGLGVTAAREAACRTIEEAEIIRVSLEDQQEIARLILEPPAPTPALKRAFRRRRALISGE